jgi:hypothetical protein
LTYTHVLDRSNYLDPTNPDFKNVIVGKHGGELGDPKDAFNWNTSLPARRFTFGYQMRYLSKMYLNTYEDFNVGSGASAGECRLCRSEILSGAVLSRRPSRVDVTKDFNFYLGVDNLTNTKPPLGLTGIGAGSSIYDVRGRFFYAGASPNSNRRNEETLRGRVTPAPLFCPRESCKKVDSAGAALHSVPWLKASPRSLVAEIERRALRLESEQSSRKREMRSTPRFNRPSSQSCVEGRARIAIQLGKKAPPSIALARSPFTMPIPNYRPDDRHCAPELGVAAIPLVEAYLDRHPQDIAAHELMADLQAQAGAGDSFIDSYHAALSKYPQSKPLLMSYWNMLSRSGRHSQAIESMDAIGFV